MAQKAEPKGTLRKIGRVWCVQYYDPARGKKTCRSLKTTIRREAEKKRVEIMAEIATLGRARRDEESLGAAMLRETERIGRDVSSSQADRAGYAFARFVEFAKKETSLRKIDKAMLERYQSERLKKVARSTVEKELAVVRHLLRENGFEVAKPRPAQGRRTPVRAFTQEELVRLFNHVTDGQRALYASLLFTGARPTELMPSKLARHKALLKNEVDLEKDTVLVRTAKGHRGERRRPRLIRVPEDVSELLAEEMTRNPGIHVFRSNTNLSRDFDSALERAGIAKVNDLGEKLTPHSFRHTYGTMLAASGLPALLLKEAMGHSKVSMTERYVDAAQSAAPVLGISLNLKRYTQRNGCKKEKDSGGEIAEVL